MLRALQGGSCLAATWLLGGYRLNRGLIRIAQLFPAFLFLLAVGLLSPATSYAQQQSQPTSPGPSPAGQVQGYTLTPGQEAQAIAYPRRRPELYFLDVGYELLVW